MNRLLVAQVGNLLCRRMGVGGAALSGHSGLPIHDTLERGPNRGAANGRSLRQTASVVRSDRSRCGSPANRLTPLRERLES